MTAINIFLRRDRAFLMTDGAFYMPDGEVVGFGNKAMPIPNLNAAIAVRGLQKVVSELAIDFSIRYRSFDEMVERVGDDLCEWQDTRSRDDAYSAWSDVDLYLVGWSDADKRAKAFNFQTRDSGSDYAVGELEEIEDFTVGPYPSEEEWFRNLASLGVDLVPENAMARFDPIKHGIPIMEAQRRMMISSDEMGSAFTGAQAVSTVGGHIILTEITKEGVSQRTVHRWADEAGVPIQPEPFRQPAKFHALAPAGMNRQQRKRFEAQKRKGAG